ncbi:MAG: putative DNA binding domain-containing protein [Roseburia sp.]|nr:putative DNA binding domain-containing protein [Roseburia sp.]MCM1099383.1 putative DNA binding domain-containing protein [Ruminococcus flavefaciens]
MTEDKRCEFKREYVDEIKNTVIAFANCDGGVLYIGCNDDGSVCGLEDVDDTMLRVTNAVRDAVRPDVTMFMECRPERMEGHDIVCVTVQRGTARPYYLAKKGIRPEGVYVRQGASTVPATETAILHMIRETSGDSYEKARSIRQQLTFEKTGAFFEKRKVEFGASQMRTLRLIGEDGTYTNLGFLLSDQCTHTIKLAVFEGCKKTIFKDRREFSGSILGQLEEAVNYIDRYNRTRAEFSGLDRLDMRDYPPDAVREALLNAVVHRDYSFNSPTLVSIYEDRIEFVTVGGLVRGIDLKDVMLGVSVLRNEYLANVFYRLRLIEAYGTGILKIKDCYGDYESQPGFETTDHAFKITLPNTNYRREFRYPESLSASTGLSSGRGYAAVEEASGADYGAMQPREAQILALCRKKGLLVRKDVEEALKVSQPTAILVLRHMADRGLLVREGSGKNTCYRPGRR